MLIQKPDNSPHFCIDFGKVNTVSKFDAYPRPSVDEFLDGSGEAQYFGFDRGVLADPFHALFSGEDGFFNTAQTI